MNEFGTVKKNTQQSMTGSSVCRKENRRAAVTQHPNLID